MRGLSPSALSAVAGITTLVASFKSLVGVSKTVISNFSHFEKLSMGLETFFQDADKGKAKFEELRKLSNATTFGVDELTDAFTQMANVGVGVDSINSRLKTLGNLASGDKAKFADLVSIYSKIQSTGKAGAMQLQQIAMRGIPIYDMLKQIGVQGTATADDITKAFVKMTSAGGQFYGAMENINKTIEGKEGFISDYFKEMTVNFAEVSGLADAYKKILDLLKDAIGNISDALLRMNDDPFMKSLVQGTLVASIVTLVTVIGITLVLAVKKLNAELLKTVALKSILDPTTLGIAVAVGAIAGVGVAITALVKNTKNANEAQRDWGTTIRTWVADGNEYKEVLTEIELKTKSIAEIYEDMSNNGKSNSFIDLLVSQQEEYKKLIDQAWLDGDTDVINEYQEKLDNITKDLEKQIAIQQSQVTVREKLLSLEEARKNELERENELFEQQLNNAQKLYGKTNQGQIDSLKSEIATYENYLKNGKMVSIANPARRFDSSAPEYINVFKKLDNDEKKFFEEALKITKDSLKSIEFQMKLKDKLEEEGGWKKIMQEALGTSDEDVVAGKLDNGGNAIKAYMDKIEKKYSDMTANNRFLGINQSVTQKDLISEQVREMISVYDKLNASGSFTEEDTTMKQFKREIDDLRQKFKDAGGSVKEFDALIGNTTSKTKNKFLEGLQGVGESVSQGSDVGNFVSTLKETGNVGTALLGTFFSALTNAIGGVQGLSLILNPVSDILKSFSPLLKSLFMLLYIFVYPLKLLAKGIEWICKLIFGDIADTWDSLNNEKRSEVENLKKVNEQYKNLLVSLKQQEEYYLEQKKIINSQSYAKDMYKVNDMILTPQGNFSTAPDDYIIATKNPSSLGKNSIVTLQPIINDYGGNDVQVQTRTNDDGYQEMIINISRKVADDYASGKNGWANAYQTRQNKINGRSVQ